MAEGYIDYAQKCDVLFQAQRDIALQIPDVTDQDIQAGEYLISINSLYFIFKFHLV